MLQLQRALSVIYPPQCPICDERIETSGGLCSVCWRKTPFITGLVCETCGVSLPGDSDDQTVFCDDCLAIERPWVKGRAALSYRDVGRRIVLSLKHGDRLDLVPLAAGWMAQSGRAVLRPETVLVPVPSHWSRLLARRYNQAAELSRRLASIAGLAHCPDALIRRRKTTKQDGKTVDQRFANLVDAIQPNTQRTDLLDGKTVCLIDDVMTSGATLTVSTNSIYALGARDVCVLVLARVEKAP